uniref:Anti-sigma factor antagonist n=1 Tax=Desulfovibrio sp. U5L TaxID=596152 RepID=I2Q3Q1_9BACT
MERLAHANTEEALVIGLSDEIIMDVVIELKAEITPLIRNASRTAVVLDLSGVTFLDSSGVGLFIGLRRLCEDEGKTFSIANPAPPIRKLFDTLRLTDYFAVSATPVASPGATPSA